jgi:6-hydroxycyclohex-1-ene-1-carbonyl-CoA dehydrogenase
VIIVGITGGVGQYMGQTAKALGAKTVIGIARNKEKLERALKFGADVVINSTDKDARAVSKEFRGICKEKGLPNTGWKIFEVSGAKPGQEIALTLVGFTSKLVVVGFSMAKTEYAIGRLMAFDADVIGTWGCLPEYYPIVLDMVLSGKINIEDFVETRPMSSIADTFAEAHKRPPMKRIVLTPDF